MAVKNIMYQQLQKICREKICCINFFGQIWEKHPLHLQTISYSCTYDKM